MCETEQQLRQLASEGKSKKEVMELMGLTRRSLRDILECLPDIQFFSGYRVYEVRGVKAPISNLAKHFNSKVPIRAIAYRISQGMSAEEALFTPKMTRTKVTVRGFTGHFKEIIDHFGLTMHEDTPGKRIRKGMSPEQAFFGS